MSTTEKKHHCMAVFKSDHLGVADLEEMIEEGKQLIFTISHVRQEYGIKVAGKKGNHNIAYFTDPNIKPWVLNSGNTKQIRLFNGGFPNVEDWKPTTIELYIDGNVKAVNGGFTSGVRIRPIQPIVGSQQKPAFDSTRFEAAKTAGATIEAIKERYTITPEVEKAYLEYGATK